MELRNGTSIDTATRRFTLNFVSREGALLAPPAHSRNCAHRRSRHGCARESAARLRWTRGERPPEDARRCLTTFTVLSKLRASVAIDIEF